MRIAIPATGPTPEAALDARFARTAQFLLFDDGSQQWEAIDNVQVLNAPQGAGIQAAETLARHRVTVVLTAHCGPKAFRVLQTAGIAVYTGVTGTVQEALETWQAGQLQPAVGPDVEGHW